MTSDPRKTDSQAPTVILPDGEIRLLGHPNPLPRIDERFTIHSVQGGPGKSGMGMVYIVSDGDRLLAIKTFQHRFAQNLPLVERFLRESRTWILLGFHRNVVQAYSIDIIDGTPYLFMEYIEPQDGIGVSMADHLQRGPLSVGQTIDLALQCCEGMAHATRAVEGLVHRDLKPENLFISKDGTLKVSDFGLVRSNMGESLALMLAAETPELPGLTQVGTAFGTPAYMAPEQFFAADKVNQSADIYALGCCFYEALTGERMFTIRASTPLEEVLRWKEFHERVHPAPLLERVEACPQELDRILMKCLEKNPKRRWQRFEEVREALIPLWERYQGREYAPPAPVESDANQVAEQFRSLKLIDGYSRAVRMSTLRQSVSTSPYAFHLALASYFHCRGDASEERRQLEKAMRCRGANRGQEAVRRLAGVLLDAGDFENAGRLLESFLEEHPADLDECIEPFVRLQIARRRFDEAEAALKRLPENQRTHWLLVQVYEQTGRFVQAAALLQRKAETILDEICADLALIDDGDRTGWDYEGDAADLLRVLEILRPEVATRCLGHTEAALWPELDAFPSFAASMAWLSEILGKLAYLPEDIALPNRDAFLESAQILGYPERLRAHLMRDEYWFWAQEASILIQ
ncbi:MAG: hypothetical protein AMXMBFR84_43510 [Candidatus Hydrogenedentota bacterium]